MSSLQPLYAIKERLEYAAIAGTNLLGEDFRLRRAAEAVKLLAAASPVFGKVSAGLDALLAAPVDQRPGLLLDVLSLVDAVAYTQGTCGLAGDLQDLPAGGGAYREISCSQIQPLLTALTGTGGGRRETIRANWEAHPEYFSDFRVLPALVNGLGDSYGEIGELTSKILKTIGPAVLPALMAGFDPKGKKDMVRRVHLIEEISGSGANDFYLSHIPEAERNVRAALVYALRHDENNGSKLIELSVTEKGSAKKMALWALARMDCPAARDYWLQSEETKKLALQYADLSTARAASLAVEEALGRWLVPYEAGSRAPIDLQGKEELDRLLSSMPGRSKSGPEIREIHRAAAEALKRWLAPYEADDGPPIDLKRKEELERLLSLLPGKSGPEICDLYRRMADAGKVLDWKSYTGTDGKSGLLQLWPSGIHSCIGGNGKFSEAVSRALRWSILFHPTPDLMALAMELYKKDHAYASAGITAALLSASAAEAFEWSGLCENPTVNPRAKFLPCGDSKVLPVNDALRDLSWDKEYGRAAWHVMLNDPADGRALEVVRPLAEPLDRRWYAALAALGKIETTVDWRLASLTPLDDPDLCRQVGEHLYDNALNGHAGANDQHMLELRRLGWDKCEGLAVNFCNKQKSGTHVWILIEVLGRLPGSRESRQREGRAVLDLIADGKCLLRTGTREQLKEFIENM